LKKSKKGNPEKKYNTMFHTKIQYQVLATLTTKTTIKVNIFITLLSPPPPPPKKKKNYIYIKENEKPKADTFLTRTRETD
jgi:hypothetical protein